MFKVLTDHPVALSSLDHIYPEGTKNDNSTDLKFIEESLKLFKNFWGLDNIKYMDLGCSGGQLVIDFLNKGNLALGLEGSDYSLNHKRANWLDYSNKNLFTCDITKPFQVLFNDEEVKFNFITAWEVIEHIVLDDLKQTFININNSLEDHGIFVGSIAQYAYFNNEGINLHRTCYPEIYWYDTIFPFYIKRN